MVHRPPTVLLTGFDAFGGELMNPSWLAVKALHGRQVAGHRVIAAQLPTVFDESLQVLRALLVKHRPMLTICVGQAGGRLMHFLTTERGFKPKRGSFIHVPLPAEQGVPSMRLVDITLGLRVALRTALTTTVDTRVNAGHVS